MAGGTSWSAAWRGAHPFIKVGREVVVRVDEVGVVGVAALGVCGRTRGREKRE